MSAVIVIKGSSKSGNYGHSGRPGQVGGSAPIGVSIVDTIDHIKALTSPGGHDSTKGFIILPNDRLVDVTGTAKGNESFEDSHYALIMEHPTLFGLPKDFSAKKSQDMYDEVIRLGNIRVRQYSLRGSGSFLSIDTAKADQATLRHLQNLIFKNKIPWGDTVNWNALGGKVSKVDIKDFLMAKYVGLKDVGYGVFQIELKEAIIVIKGSSSSGNFGHAGRPGKIGGSAPEGTELRDLNYSEQFEQARKAGDKRVYGGFETAWLKDNFDIPYDLNNWGQYNNKYTNIRNSYVINDDKTLKLNRSLRKGNPPTAWAENIDTLCESTFKYNSQVYRGAALSPKIIDQMFATKKFTDLGFMSTSGERDMSQSYLDSRFNAAHESVTAVMFNLTVPKGSHVGIMDTGELVLPRGTSILIDHWEIVYGQYEVYGKVQTP